jgi:lysyl-tRNA synthetase class 1
MDEFAEFAAKADKTTDEQQLWYLATRGKNERRSVARVPFSHLVASYQASLKNLDKTLEVIKRTEHAKAAEEDADIIKAELQFIDHWLEKRAPDEVKFSLREQIDHSLFTDVQRDYLNKLADKIDRAPEDADGEWFHKAIYEFKDDSGLEPKELFTVLYQALIAKDAGPRAGWFLSILPRDWLIKRLRLEA